MYCAICEFSMRGSLADEKNNSTPETFPPDNSTAEQPPQQRQRRTEQQTGGDGKIELKAVARIMNVARQTAHPAFADARPQQRADQRQEQSQQYQHLAEIVHAFNLTRAAAGGKCSLPAIRCQANFCNRSRMPQIGRQPVPLSQPA